MSRTLSAPALAGALAQQTDKVYLVLLVVSHASLVTPLRFVNDMRDLVVGGDTYTAYPFDVELPGESEGSPPQSRLVIDNVSRAVTDAIRSLATAPTITLSVVLASSPTTVEAGPFPMQLIEMTFDAFVVSGVLSFERMLSEPYPSGVFNPRDFPGLF